MLRCNRCNHICRCPVCERTRYASCVACGKPVRHGVTRCRPCHLKALQDALLLNYGTKADWPTHEKLQELVEVMGYLGVGRMLGVSNNAVKKRYLRYCK